MSTVIASLITSQIAVIIHSTTKVNANDLFSHSLKRLYIYLLILSQLFIESFYILGIVIGTKDAVSNKTAFLSSGSLHSSGEKDNRHMHNNFRKWKSVMK